MTIATSFHSSLPRALRAFNLFRIDRALSARLRRKFPFSSASYPPCRSEGVIRDGLTYINGKPVARFEKGCTDGKGESDKCFPVNERGRETNPSGRMGKLQGWRKEEKGKKRRRETPGAREESGHNTAIRPTEARTKRQKGVRQSPEWTPRGFFNDPSWPRPA